jgi:hypothetical protein
MGRMSSSLRGLGLGLIVWLAAPAPPVAQARPAPPVARPVPGLSPAIEAALRVIRSGHYGGRGADLMPLNPTTVQLRAAEARLTQIAEPDGWQITATYDLWNPARAPAPLSLLFPEELCEPGAGHECMPMRGAFLSPSARFVGQPLEFTLSGPDAVRPWATTPGKGYTYQLTVPPKKLSRVVQEFRLERSGGPEWWGVHYVSAAGSYAGPIAQVRYVVELLSPMRYVVFPRAFTLRGFSEEPGSAGRGSTTRLTFTAEKLDERSDFLVAFPAQSLNGLSSAGYCVGYRGDKTAAELAEALRGYDLARMRACREHVLALHGYPFSDAGLRARYYRNSPRLPSWADEEHFTIAAHPEDPSYREALLSPGEQAYLKALGPPAP